MDEKSQQSKKEEEILAFWNKNDIFRKSLEKQSPRGDFIFYDGPPFASGEPHYGHVVPGTIKDIIPRFKTMQGYKVRRRWGWDCHGLPVENLIEKELGLGTKKDILSYGIEKFNEKARESVMRYAHDWREIIPRLGRWVDMDDDYRTMDSTYTESVWWAFSSLYKKGLIYEAFKAMHICPHCETTLSNFEVTQNYIDITDISVYVKFELADEPASFLLAWTTTPWTLPGNAALAINPNIKYVKFKVKDAQGGSGQQNEKYIVSENGLESLKKKGIVKGEVEVLETFSGSALLNKKYKPVFDYYTSSWKICAGDFVKDDEGTGIVHIAPAFGKEDYELSKKENIPFIQHVSIDGKFKPEVKDFAGKSVKPKGEGKDAHQVSDVEIIKYLAHHNSLFAKEKIVHAYPHCWRCDTPLLNYATSSWFVAVSRMKDKLVKENEKVSWVPEEVGTLRFGNWLKGAHDWAISRSRFWGAPLPVWRVADKKDDKKSGTGEIIVLDSIGKLRQHTRSNNSYFVMRHGEAVHNTKNIMSTREDDPSHLTEKGKKEAKESGKNLVHKKIDLIIASPFVRTRETLACVNESLKLPQDKIIFDKRVSELNAGVFHGKPLADYHLFFKNDSEYFTKGPDQGESFSDIRARVGELMYELESKHKGKNILILTHNRVAWLVNAVANMSLTEDLIKGPVKDDFLNYAEVRKLDFKQMPHNRRYELDLHRPYIDEVELYNHKNQKLERVNEVFDCWFESGSMPFGEVHYPFSKEEFNPGGFLKKSKGYPADFIAEGSDQTRGWFYSMMVLGVLLFGKSPYKRVIANGLLLAEDGQKMSKRKKNYPDIKIILNKFGADALRFFLMSSSIVRAQDVCFAEKSVDEVVKKNIGRLNNVVTFYEMFTSVKDGKQEDAQKTTKEQTTNVLDQWILARLKELRQEVTTNLEKYEIDRATRPFTDFIDDLSVWYIRRSRDRFKAGGEEAKQALNTTRYVLLNLSKLVAPFMPFLAEDIYKRVHGELESVHLESWPDLGQLDKKDKDVIEKMKETRRITSSALESRINAKINVRQPLKTLKIKSIVSLDRDYLSIIKDELNVKEVLVDTSMKDEVWLDTNISEKLKEEGKVRELIRLIQDLRKEANLNVSVIVSIEVGSDYESAKILEKHKTDIMKVTGLSDIQFVAGNVAPHIYNRGLHN